jgi:hypothetical protein
VVGVDDLAATGSRRLVVIHPCYALARSRSRAVERTRVHHSNSASRPSRARSWNPLVVSQSGLIVDLQRLVRQALRSVRVVAPDARITRHLVTG